MTEDIRSEVELPDVLAGTESGVLSPGGAAVQPWDEVVDVLVVGFGAAGASAAIEAGTLGASVLVVDRFAGGGATGKSGGVVYLGGGTDLQKAAGYDDTPEEMFQYLSLEAGDVVSEEVLRAFCETSVENFHWLRRMGVPFPPSGKVVKVSYPVSDCTLYFSGNEKSPPYCDAARPAPRGHRTLGEGTTGDVLFRVLRRAATDAGARFLECTKVRRLIRDEKGSVVGAELLEIDPRGPWRRLHSVLGNLVTYLGGPDPRANRFFQERLAKLEARHGRIRHVRVKKGVVLSAGGFVFDLEMMRKHAPGYLKCSLRLGTAGDDGSGIRLGLSVGGKTGHLDRCSAWRFINPPAAWLRGILVGPEGKRVCNEELYGGAIGEHMAAAHDGRAVLILDATAMAASRREIMRDRMLSFQRVFGVINDFVNRKKAWTLEELGRKCGMGPGVLVKLVEEYNEGAASGLDPVGKSRKFLVPVRVPPFYAVNIDFDNKLFITPSMTLGGLVVDGTTARVVREDGTPIEGLYAAGRNAVGVSSRSYVSGLSIADCIFSGRNAGRHAAGRVPGKKKRGRKQKIQVQSATSSG